MSYKAEKLAKQKCENWSCWKELSDFEKEDTFNDYMEMYELGKSESLAQIKTSSQPEEKK